jgi:AAA+ superfamily predicted ATPase
LFRRFDDLLEFPLPDRTLIRQTIERRLASAPAKAKVDLTTLSSAARGMSSAEIVKARDEAIKGALLLDRNRLGTADMLAAIRERRMFLRRGK